jgi:hypothetical protein
MATSLRLEPFLSMFIAMPIAGVAVELGDILRFEVSHFYFDVPHSPLQRDFSANTKAY